MSCFLIFFVIIIIIIALSVARKEINIGRMRYNVISFVVYFCLSMY